MKEYLFSKFKELFRDNNKKPPEKGAFLKQISINKNLKIVNLQDEINIFKQLFQLNSNKVLYHYTSFETLLNILKSGKIKFSGVAGFNDANELRSKSTIIGSGLKHPYNKTRMNIINNRYAFCLSKREDDLNQWRLYGDDGKGICLGFKIETKKLNTKKFYAGEIIYGDTIKLFINEIINYISKKWDYTLNIDHSSKWGYFIKGQEWEDEREVRLLLITTKGDPNYDINSWSSNSHGILYPSIFVELDHSGLNLSSITLGPKCPVPELNKAQISILLNTCSKHWNAKPIKLSQIKSYR
jgi:hypothetical protein